MSRQTRVVGAWGAFIHLVDGENEIEVSARANDGSETTKTLVLRPADGATPAAVPHVLLARYNWLLDECLTGLKRVHGELQQERDERIRRSLRIEIEREREEALRRAARQRKELRIFVEEDDGSAAP